MRYAFRDSLKSLCYRVSTYFTQRTYDSALIRKYFAIHPMLLLRWSVVEAPLPLPRTRQIERPIPILFRRSTRRASFPRLGFACADSSPLARGGLPCTT